MIGAILALVVLDIASLRWGADSRDYSGRRNWW